MLPRFSTFISEGVRRKGGGSRSLCQAFAVAPNHGWWLRGEAVLCPSSLWPFVPLAALKGVEEAAPISQRQEELHRASLLMSDFGRRKEFCLPLSS